MATEVVMPKFGLTMAEGTIQKWFKAEGEEISAGEPLFEVETEKILYEVEVTVSGTVASLLYPVESVVLVGEPVAVIAAPGEDLAGLQAQSPGASAPSPVAPDPVADQSAAAANVSITRGRRDTPIVSPAARKLAKENQVDLATLVGTGPRGRITREDVRQAIGRTPSETVTPSVPAAAPCSVSGAEVPGSGKSPLPCPEPLQGIRGRIADRMHKSLLNTAQLTLTTEVDVTNLVARRNELRSAFKVTYSDFIVQACAHALRAHPRMNTTFEGEAIQWHDTASVGVAVAIDQGLIVPVIRNADQKPLRGISEEMSGLVEKARLGKLTADDITGGTFTVSNLGMFGVDTFTPILNSPETGILGVGRIIEKPAIFEGEVTKRSMIGLSLTIDHRVIDGAPAGEFLQTVADFLSHGNRRSLDPLG